VTAASTRRRRSDAGVVAVTERDVRALGFVGEQYAVRDDLLEVVLARLAPAGLVPAAELSRRTARGWLDRMTRAGYLSRQRLLGRTWAVATERGLRVAGLPYEPWQPNAWQLAHRHAVAVVRLALEAAHPGVAWTGERAIRSHWHGSGARVRYADGALAFRTGRVGVEVELSRKAAGRYESIVRDVDTSFAEVWWFTPPGDVAWLRQVLAAASRGGPVHRVAELPGELT